MSKIEWLEKRRRAARCKIHGLHYDPSMTSGCVLCRKEGLLKEKPKGPQLIMLLLAILGMTVAAFQIYGPVTSTFNELRLRTFPVENADEPRPVSAPPATRIDPNAIRTDLERFETALLSPRSDQIDNIRDEILTSGQTLSRRLGGLDQQTAPQIAAKISSIVELASAQELNLKHLGKVRKRWFEIRAESFLAAPWFKTPTSANELDRAQVAIYREVAYQLQALISDGSQSLNSSGESKEAWTSLASNWKAETQALRSRLPSRPGANADANLLLAVQQLERSLRDLQSMASASTSPPFDRLENLSSVVQQALRTLDDLLI